MSETWQAIISATGYTAIFAFVMIVVPAFIRVWRRRRRRHKANGGSIVAAGGFCAPNEYLYDIVSLEPNTKYRAQWTPGEEMTTVTEVEPAEEPEPLPEIGKVETDVEWVILHRWDDIWDRDVQTFVNELEAQKAYMKELAHTYDDEIVVLAQRTTIEQTVAAQHGGRGPRPEPTEEEKARQAEMLGKGILAAFPEANVRRGGIAFNTGAYGVRPDGIIDDNTHGR